MKKRTDLSAPHSLSNDELNTFRDDCRRSSLWDVMDKMSALVSQGLEDGDGEPEFSHWWSELWIWLDERCPERRKLLEDQTWKK